MYTSMNTSSLMSSVAQLFAKVKDLKTQQQQHIFFRRSVFVEIELLRWILAPLRLATSPATRLHETCMSGRGMHYASADKAARQAYFVPRLNLIDNKAQ